MAMCGGIGTGSGRAMGSYTFGKSNLMAVALVRLLGGTQIPVTSTPSPSSTKLAADNTSSSIALEWITEREYAGNFDGVAWIELPDEIEVADGFRPICDSTGPLLGATM
uniref:Uncharacterized protein n=1 Tax=Photinus pyralis TaxID=7054 RepID=A0A1Y1KT17_PHOPY